MPELSGQLTSLFGNPTAMFKPEVYANIQNKDISQYTVVITPNDKSDTEITGLLTNNFVLSTNANWAASNILDTVTSNIPILQTVYPYITTVMGMGGLANPNNLGMSSKKIYNNSGYLELNIEFRVVDWRGDGQAQKTAFVLSSMLVPKKKSSYSAGEIVLDAAEGTLKWVGSAYAKWLGEGAASVAEGALTFVGAVAEGATRKIVGFMGGNANEALSYVNDSQFFVTASSPAPVTIKIGHYFAHNDMVIETAECEFSKAMTTSGPLYIDFRIKASSRQTVLLDDEGFINQQFGLTAYPPGGRIMNELTAMNNNMNAQMAAFEEGQAL